MILLRFCALFLVCVLASAARGEGVPAQNGDAQLKLAQAVHDIFEAKCIDCHGAELPRPKGKFGYVLDLQRVAENPKMIVRGKPDDSDLYDMIVHDEMPGEDANVPPLTPEEKESVKRWIEAGAPATLLPSGEQATPIASANPPEVQMPLWKRTLRWIGRFHPVSTHFPVALMFVAVFAEALAWWTRRESWLQTVRLLVVLGALGAIAATGLGWVNAYFSSYVGQSAAVLQWHRWLGTFTAVWAAGCAGLSVSAECEEGSPERRRFRGALLVGALLIGVSGFLGSALIFGLDHYAWK